MSLPTYELEMLAMEQRKQIGSSLQELKKRMQENLNVQNRVREHILLASGAAAILGLMAGYRAGGIFMPRKPSI